MSAMFASPPSPEQRHRMIEQAAYYRAQRRNFSPGGALGDWLEAEAEIDRMLAAAEAQPAEEYPAMTETEARQIQEGEPRSIARQEALKRLVRQHPQRDLPRVDSVDSEDLRGR